MSERKRVHAAVVPGEHHPASGLQDAGEFAACALGLEPVERLSRGDEIHTSVFQRSRFRRTLDAAEPIIGREIFFTGAAHRFVWLHALASFAFLEKNFAKKAGTRADIRDHIPW